MRAQRGSTGTCHLPTIRGCQVLAPAPMGQGLVHNRTEFVQIEGLAEGMEGAMLHDLRKYVREKEQEEGSPWRLPEGAQPLSDSQIWRYTAAADKLMAQNLRASRAA